MFSIVLLLFRLINQSISQIKKKYFNNQREADEYEGIITNGSVILSL
ncbi:hypothetical protein HMPREF0765_4107 [Sphingobacterium spiritivorum ATCC 33300]|uniref:Uncharacterized protein n=1 Tax=Sphingobacterium spiritivorum ATCC 33300 TaxID=525372 RepID=C2G3F1_SPHSI|nr:hypothetical protein HMPREF0765_4107 [Sphingobacterium spiritivorum ATCC 33300]